MHQSSCFLQLSKTKTLFVEVPSNVANWTKRPYMSKFNTLIMNDLFEGFILKISFQQQLRIIWLGKSILDNKFLDLQNLQVDCEANSK